MGYKEWRKPETYGPLDASFYNGLKRNAAIDEVSRGIWSTNVWDAKNYKFPFVSDLYGTRRGPVLVCGAGPSLKREAQYIRQAADNGWAIVATDRALNDIRKMGVKEELSITTECQPECGDFLKAAGKDDSVVVNLISSPAIRKELSCRKANVFHAAPMNPYDPFWNWIYGKDFWGRNVGCFRPHLIVTFCAVDIAYWMGFNPIVTIGNDLCYDSPYACSNDTALFRDGTRGQIRKLVKGKWSFTMFEEAASGFSAFQLWHPSRTFIDGSYGISPWPKAQLKDLVGPVH